MPRPMPRTKLDTVEKLILALLKDARRKVGPKGRVPVNDPDYANAFGAHQGFLIMCYGSYSPSMPITLPDGTASTANDWFRSLRDQVDPV